MGYVGGTGIPMHLIWTNTSVSACARVLGWNSSHVRLCGRGHALTACSQQGTSTRPLRIPTDLRWHHCVESCTMCQPCCLAGGGVAEQMDGRDCADQSRTTLNGDGFVTWLLDVVERCTSQCLRWGCDFTIMMEDRIDDRAMLCTMWQLHILMGILLVRQEIPYALEYGTDGFPCTRAVQTLQGYYVWLATDEERMYDARMSMDLRIPEWMKWGAHMQFQSDRQILSRTWYRTVAAWWISWMRSLVSSVVATHETMRYGSCCEPVDNCMQ